MAASVLLPGSVPRVEYASLSLLLNVPSNASGNATAAIAEESVMSEPLLVVSPLLTLPLDTTRSSLLELHQHLSCCASASSRRREARRLSISGDDAGGVNDEDDEEDDLLGSEHDLTMEQAPIRPHQQSRRETRKRMAQERRAAARRQFYQSESSSATTSSTGRLVGGGMPESGVFRPSNGGGGSLRLHYVVISDAEAIRNCASFLVGSGKKQKRASSPSKAGAASGPIANNSHHGSNAIARSSMHSARSTSSRKSTSSNSSSKSRGSRSLGIPNTSLRGSNRSSTASANSNHMNNNSNHSKFVVTSLDDASTTSSSSRRGGGGSMDGAVRAAVLCVGVVGTSWTVYGSGGPLMLSLVSHRLRDCATVLSHVRPGGNGRHDDDDDDDDDDDEGVEAALEFGHSVLNALLMDEEEHRTNADVGLPTDEDKDGDAADDKDDVVVSSFSTPRTSVSSKLTKKFTFSTPSDFRHSGRRRSTLLRRRFGGSGVMSDVDGVGGSLAGGGAGAGSAATTTTTASAMMLLSSAQWSRMVSDQLHILAVNETDMHLRRYEARERLLTAHNVPFGKASALRGASRRTARRTGGNSATTKSSLLDASIMGCDLSGFDYVSPPPTSAPSTSLVAASALTGEGSVTGASSSVSPPHAREPLPSSMFDRLSPIEPVKKKAFIPALRKNNRDTKALQGRGGGAPSSLSPAAAVDGVFAKNTPFLLDDDNDSVSVRNGRRNGNSSRHNNTMTTFDPFSSTGGGLDGGEAHPYDSFVPGGDDSVFSPHHPNHNSSNNTGAGTSAGAKAAEAARAAAAQAAAATSSILSFGDLAASGGAAFAPQPGDPFHHARRPPPPQSSDSMSVISGITGASGLTDAVSLTRVRRIPVHSTSPETVSDDEAVNAAANAARRAAVAAQAAVEKSSLKRGVSSPISQTSNPFGGRSFVSSGSLEPPPFIRPVSTSAPPHLVVHIALNEDLSCSYKSSKLSSCSIEGVVQIQVKTDSPVYVPFTLFLRDPSRHIKTIQENRKYADDVSHEVQLFDDTHRNGGTGAGGGVGGARSGGGGSGEAGDRKFIVTVPKADSYFPVMRYKCSSELRPVPIRVQTRVRLHGKYCRVALQISSNPANEEDLTDLTIIMAVPSQIKGETLTTSPAGGVWNQSKGSVLWCVAELGGGEKFQLQAQFEMETQADKLPPDAPKPSFPVLVRCQCMYAQLSDLEFEVQDIPEVFPANVSMKLARRFRLSHREKA